MARVVCPNTVHRLAPSNRHLHLQHSRQRTAESTCFEATLNDGDGCSSPMYKLVPLTNTGRYTLQHNRQRTAAGAFYNIDGIHGEGDT
jgi:hypothetical protein